MSFGSGFRLGSDVGFRARALCKGGHAELGLGLGLELGLGFWDSRAWLELVLRSGEGRQHTAGCMAAELELALKVGLGSGLGIAGFQWRVRFE